MVSGVYAIQNALTGDRYIGSSKDMPARILGHFKSLVKGNHGNRHLQRAFDKYPDEVFFAYPLLRCNEGNLLLFEQRCLDGLRPEYNESIDAKSPCRGRKFPERKRLSNEDREKLSVVHTGLPWSEKRRAVGMHPNSARAGGLAVQAKVRAGLLQNGWHTPEAVAKAAAAKRGRPLSEEHRRAVGEALRRAYAEGRRGKRQ